MLTYNKIVRYNKVTVKAVALFLSHFKSRQIQIRHEKGMIVMWNPSKSVILSSVCTKVVIALVLVFAFAAPSLVNSYLSYTSKNPELMSPLLITIYACTLPAMAALYSLDRMLANIKKQGVFIE